MSARKALWDKKKQRDAWQKCNGYFVYLAMSLLKKLRKKSKRSGVAQGLQVVANVQKMVDAGAMRFELEDGFAHIHHDLFWKDKDLEFKKNFSRNLQVYMNVMRNSDKDFLLTIFDIEKGNLLASFDQKGGFEEA